jgi:hypothetical protein
MHFVAVATAVARFGQVARFLKVLDDLRSSSFRNADIGRDVPEPRTGVGGDALEGVSVVRDEPP